MGEKLRLEKVETILAGVGKGWGNKRQRTYSPSSPYKMENKKSVFYHLSFDQISIFSNTKKKCPWAFLFVYSNSFHFRKPIYRYSLWSRCFRPRFDRKSWNSKSWKIHKDRPFHIVCTDARAHRHAHKHARTCRYTHKHNVRRTCTDDKIKNHKFTYYQLSNYSLKTFMGVPKMLL